MKIKSIVVVGRRFFRSVGHTIHTSEIIADGQPLAKLGPVYGYGSHYEETARKWLIEKGVLTAPSDHYASLYSLCGRAGISYTATVADVRKKGDL